MGVIFQCQGCGGFFIFLTATNNSDVLGAWGGAGGGVLEQRHVGGGVGLDSGGVMRY